MGRAHSQRVTFHVKASAAMTWHEGEPTDAAFVEFRGALEPLELSKEELTRARGRLDPLVALIEFRRARAGGGGCAERGRRR